MITKEECMPMILENFPGFYQMWCKHLEKWGNDTPGLCIDVAIFSEYMVQLLQIGKNTEEIKEIFLFIEKLMCEGSQEVQEAAATCFLENLVNAAGWKTIAAASFSPYLGKESREYCKAWDEFCKVKAPGLCDDEKNTASK